MEKKKGLVLGGLLLLGIGFAAVSTILYLNGDINISANQEDFDIKFTKAVIDTEDKTGDSISVDGKSISFTTKELQSLNDKSVLDFEVTNNSSFYDAEVSIECTSGEKGEYYQITKEVTNLVSAKTTESGKVEVQKIKMVEEDIEERFTCTLTAKALERTTKGVEVPKVNKNIVNTDEECYKNKEAGSCAPGTEIRYMVNNYDEKTFNVLHDDGATMTLLQNENIVNNVPWNDTQDNSKVPLKALSSLENATNGWSNVNILTYSIGSSSSTLGESGATYSGDGNHRLIFGSTYSIENKTAKSRLVTLQELNDVGCIESVCPSWAISTEYWTMTSELYSQDEAWSVNNYIGNIANNYLTTDISGVRAVIEINKYM